MDLSYSDPVTAGDLDVKVAIAEHVDFGFVPNLEFGADVILKDILGTNTMGTDLNVSGSYNIDGIKPGFAVGYDMGINSVTNDEVLDLDVYLELKGLVDLTTFTLRFKSLQLSSGKALAQDKGIITFDTKVAY